jgi:hypothetical protein
MLTKITDLLWIDLDRITLMGLYPHEAHATLRLLDDDRDYYLAKDDFVRLLDKYENHLYGAAIKYRDQIFHE